MSHTATQTSKRKREMKVIAAYLLAVLGGNACPSAGDIKKILSSVGAEADDDRIELLLSQVEGKDITELIAAGREKLASVPSGGGAVAVAAPSAGVFLIRSVLLALFLFGEHSQALRFILLGDFVYCGLDVLCQF
nr:60S acidic ribosomal protein P2B-like [Ipomoea batatas]